MWLRDLTVAQSKVDVLYSQNIKEAGVVKGFSSVRPGRNPSMKYTRSLPEELIELQFKPRTQ